MKHCFAVIALCAAVVVSAADTAVLRFAENSTVAAMEINVRDLMKHPEVTKVLNDPENLQRRSEIEKKTGVRLNDFKKLFVLVNAEGEIVFLINVDKNFNVEQVLTKNNVKFQQKMIAGKKVLLLADADKKGKQVELFTLAPGMIFAGESGNAARYLGTARGKVASLANAVREVPDNAPVWAAFVNTSKNAQGGIDDPRQLYVTFQFAGAQKCDLDFRLVLACGKADGASQMSGMLPFYVNMGAAFIFGNDPELNKKIRECVKIELSGNRVLVSFYVPEYVARKIGAYFQKNADKFIKQGMNAAGIQAPASTTAPAAK